MAKDKEEDLTPYPTQEQNDRAKLGLDPHSDEKADKDAKVEEKTSREAKASGASGGSYQTRASGKD